MISRRWLLSGSSVPPLTMSSASCGEKKRRSRPTRSSSPTCSATRRSSEAFQSLTSAASVSTVSCRRLILQHRAYTGGQCGVVDRFGQVLIAAGLEPRDHVLGIRHRGHHDDRRERERGIGAQAPTHLKAVELGHHDVEQYQIRSMLPGGRQPFLAIGRGEDLVTFRSQSSLQDLTFVGLSSTMRMRGGVLTNDSPSDLGNIRPWPEMHKDTKAVRTACDSHSKIWSSAKRPEVKLEQLAERVQRRTVLRFLVRWVAGIRASVHTKLLAAFLIVTLLFIAMALVSLADHRQRDAPEPAARRSA